MPSRYLSRRPRPTHIRALEVIAKGGHEGCTEALMLAHGFPTELMAALMREGLATVTAERIRAGSRVMDVLRLRITAAGQRALELGAGRDR